ncbi:hypothetical protein E2C01_054223 [Portunus trituberculatus]|uniref:Uncharacterized protein n=1 Tax=Portunus trituberculatus TaxID=210409 RepID=A0A5B7GS71_PORTR|nr:hypothetical protein [Portunus trituberculatus]
MRPVLQKLAANLGAQRGTSLPTINFPHRPFAQPPELLHSYSTTTNDCTHKITSTLNHICKHSAYDRKDTYEYRHQVSGAAVIEASEDRASHSIAVPHCTGATE